ncbi:MAG: BamA/TamA family outer membrane protein [Flavobacteriales bacterium]|nr:BamA/TamA family outer membrane protein [Flavobacteriales bacterium]MBP9079000.1 BamA/TamA family outer membrane protein [Flavobacteriales bacterium]
MVLRAQSFTVDFSGPYGISGLLVEGNKQTKERIILRELTFRQGDTVDTKALYERMARSRQNLLNLGLFNTVTLLPTFLGPHEVFITITVNERWYWWPQPMVRFADPNFNTWWLTKDFGRLNYGVELNRFNMRGRNETLSALVQLGYSRRFGLRYKVPSFDRQQRWGAQVEGVYGEQDEITIGTEGNKRILLKTPLENITAHWRAGGQLTYRRSHYIRHGLDIHWNEMAVRDTVVRRNPEYLASGAGRMGFLSLTYSAVLDRRDSRAFPLSGTYAKLEVVRHGIGPSQPDATRLTATVQRSWKRGQRWSLGASMQGSAAPGTEDHYFLQEGLGYGDYLRGYEYYIIDGQAHVLAKANILFALVPPRSYRVEAIPLEAFRTLYIAIYLNAFSDHGYVQDNVHGALNPLANQWQQSYGLGLDLVTSYDQVLRMEWAVNRLAETGFYLHFTQPF